MLVTNALGRLAMISALLVPSTLYAFDDDWDDEFPDPSEVYINGISYAGSGCPAGSVGEYVSEDAKAFTLAFDEYYAEAGPDVPRKDSRKFCNLNIDLHLPNGWQYTIFKVDYRGYADMERGTRGYQRSQYRFSGAHGRNNKVTLTSYLRGEFNDEYEISDDIGLSSLVWSPCGVNRALNIKTQLAVQARRGKSAFMTLDTVDGEFEQIYHLQFRRCKRNDWNDDDDWDDDDFFERF